MVLSPLSVKTTTYINYGESLLRNLKPMMNPGAAGNALQKKKPDIIRLGLIYMINTQMKFVKLKTYLKIALGITLKI